MIANGLELPVRFVVVDVVVGAFGWVVRKWTRVYLYDPSLDEALRVAVVWFSV
jgi:hypothetical protein